MSLTTNMTDCLRAAAESLDPSTKVGALVIGRDGPTRPRHNRFLGAVDPASATREERYAAVIHAEAQALLDAGPFARGGVLFSTHEPCLPCMKLVVAAGVSEVVFISTDAERRERWGCAAARALAFAEGVKLTEVDPGTLEPHDVVRP